MTVMMMMSTIANKMMGMAMMFIHIYKYHNDGIYTYDNHGSDAGNCDDDGDDHEDGCRDPPDD